ncbi:terminase small subunit, Nu1 [Rhodospirillum centenum]|uniref:Probable terminase small subunit, Nu1 n=1 Tax=Rhodospirillum centenum (strain ATCC 51521 / SW) TaxID=414684 RepID=B6IPX8_RHOCS|nr:terminase small subunit, Nu1 [Rhodospirillum centenum]ACI97514.1 probable terminase small subunit, Nu1 [Rhodospirillum centenum SW]
MAGNGQPLAVIAKLLDLSERRVQQLSREGVIPKAERGAYDLVGAVRGYVRYLRDLAQRAQGGVADLPTERTRLVKAKADLAELDAQQRRGDLVPVAETALAWAAVTARLRARLITLPDKLAPLVHDAANPAAVRVLLRSAIVEALAELAATPVAVAPAPDRASGAGEAGDDGVADADAAAGPDGEPMGGRQPPAEF